MAFFFCVCVYESSNVERNNFLSLLISTSHFSLKKKKEEVTKQTHKRSGLADKQPGLQTGCNLVQQTAKTNFP